MTHIRSALFIVLFYVAFFILAIAGLPCIAVSRRASLGLVKLWARVSLALLRVVCGVRTDFRNLHLLPKGASIIAVKHQSFLETFALITVLDDFSFVLKKELLNLPLFGWYARASGQIGIDRSRRGAAIAQLKADSKARLDAGRQLVIFPEGTRRLVGAPPQYKPGVAAVYAVADVPCTPVALNTGLFWPRRSFLRRPGTVVIEFLPPIPSSLPRAEFMRALQGAIEPATSALVAEALSDHPALRRAISKAGPEPVRA